MRFRWGSSSHIATVTSNSPSVAGASAAPKNLTKPVHGLKRSRTLDRGSLHGSVTMAKTAAAKKEKVKVTQNHKANTAKFPHVYVGNIDPIIRKEDLEALFGQCGRIHDVQIRCSRGQAINAGVAIPKEVRTRRDRQYATVEFTESKAVLKAIRKNGSIIKGCKLLVTVSAADLPEVKDIMEFRLGKLRGLTNPYNLGAGASRRPIAVEPTQEVFTDRHHLFGMSFAKCIA